MKYILSRFNHDVSWLKEYSEDWVMYDRSDVPIKDRRVIPTENWGSDIRDKFTFIIDNYDNLPDVAVYSKANLFKYISKEEFDKIKDNKTFTPILTQNHKEKTGVCYYKDNIYWEINNNWFLIAHKPKSMESVTSLKAILGIDQMDFIPFAPGSNYIVPRENILKHSKEHYKKLRSFLEWDVYPGEAMIMERGLYNLWK